MLLPLFTHVRQHSAAPKQLAWTLNVQNIPISGYTTDDGVARDIMIHFERFSIVSDPCHAETFLNGIVI